MTMARHLSYGIDFFRVVFISAIQPLYQFVIGSAHKNVTVNQLGPIDHDFFSWCIASDIYLKLQAVSLEKVSIFSWS